MKMEQYWPQHKVFFLATLSLFPERLLDTVITVLFFKPYFAADNPEVIELTLMEYAKIGYIEFQKLSNGEFKITKTNSLLATDDLTEYIDYWKNNQLSLLEAHKPETSDELNRRLFLALAKSYKPDSNQVRVLHEDVFSTDKSQIYGKAFWETVLSLQFTDLKAKVINIGYDRSMSGLYGDNPQPYIDFEITDQKFLRSIELASKNSEPINDEDPDELESKGLLIGRDGLVSYSGKTLAFTAQERDILRVLMKRPGELCTKDDFKDPHVGIFKTAHNYPDIDTTLRKLIAATHKKLRVALGRHCIINVAGEGWRLEL
ncbi:MAG TPA: helix-turn-helix domain-containing protein [Candidatus Saccharimonadales bacterium]|nr:helix-turn-helix domain-containing protein [Candidatus Saccharimonadales bacterium]